MISILQPLVPHYRFGFFDGLNLALQNKLKVLTYNNDGTSKGEGFSIDKKSYISHVANVCIKGILFYNPLPFLKKSVSSCVLMLHFAHVTTWLLLFTKFIHRKKIILWGHGISVKRYLKEQSQPDWKLSLMIRLSDGVWFYTPEELKIWKNFFPNKKMVALGNTISGVDSALAHTASSEEKESLKKLFNVTQDFVIIFCARFNSTYRRLDLLLETIRSLDPQKFAFVIIGDGKDKPDFSTFSNVYDFGAVYDNTLKERLFDISDVYFQPGWVGLSIVEAMAYGKPIFTFKRSLEVCQCVEYSYIADGINGKLFTSINECIDTFNSVSKDDILSMSACAKEYVRKNLTMKKMVDNATTLINELQR